MNRRRFGSVRKLPSGRWQASYVGVDGTRRSARDTFRTKTDADRWLASVETDQVRGQWVDDAAGRVPFGDYAQHWLSTHPRLGPRWRETCERNLRLHLGPLKDVPLRDLSPALVREWHSSALHGTGGRTSIAQSYRFMRAVLNTAVRDGAIARNPCQIPGAGADRAAERGNCDGTADAHRAAQPTRPVRLAAQDRRGLPHRRPATAHTAARPWAPRPVRRRRVRIRGTGRRTDARRRVAAGVRTRSQQDRS